MSKNVNADFFKTWSPAMAWVLGVIATDGCIFIDKKAYRNQLIITMKDLDILQKVKIAMNSNHAIQNVTYSKWNRRFSIYRLIIARKEIVGDLLKLGVKPRKSKTLHLPEIPSQLFSHFLRGCFDGDGCIVTRKGSIKPSCRYRLYSGSKVFTRQIARELKKRGFPTSYLIKKSGAYQITTSSKTGSWLYQNKGNWFGARKYNSAVNVL